MQEISPKQHHPTKEVTSQPNKVLAYLCAIMFTFDVVTSDLPGGSFDALFELWSTELL